MNLRESPSIWEVIASKPKTTKPGPKVKPKMYQHSTKVKRADELEDARLNLALLGILEPDGSFKQW